MSRIIRRQLFELLDTLDEADKVIGNILKSKDHTGLTNLLADCQDCAITIGTQIEKIYPAAIRSIKELEDYCENLFHLLQAAENHSAMDSEKKQLKVTLKNIRKTMEEEIPDKVEIAFMPYKASMWDALESVYLAAKEDEDCEAYCVPIPYFDKNPDGSLAVMHDERDEYPENIEVTSWEEYKLEERRPDIIYIHNPYDDSNYVTCVHPKFFSKNLKKYTDKLVYIPYFVAPEIMPDEQERIEKMKHFCFLPGIIFADYVILQSENIRQIYINEYIKAAKAHGLGGEHVDKKYLEKKFLGLGSPKFDKVLSCRREDYI